MPMSVPSKGAKYATSEGRAEWLRNVSKSSIAIIYAHECGFTANAQMRQQE